MTRKKKTPPPENETLAPGIERTTVGNRIIRQSFISIRREIASREDRERFGVGWGPNFELAIAASIEREAKNILEKAGLPTDPGDPCPITDEEIFGPMVAIMRAPLYLNTGGSSNFLPIRPREKCLVHLVEDRGYRKREAPEWYAAAILYTLWSIRIHSMQQGNDIALVMVYKLGNHVTEPKALGFFQQTGAEASRNRKRILPVEELVRYLIRKNRQGTARELWDAIPTDMIDGIRIKGYKFYRNAGRLLALGKVDGYKDLRPVGKPLRYRAFQKRVTKARKPSTR